MNEKQKRFAEIYAANPNATEAAKRAGYSDKTARSQGQRLLTNVDILKYIRNIQDDAASERVASLIETKAFWSDVMNNQNEKTADRLKASELLAKSSGAFASTSALKLSADETAFITSTSGENDVIIYMPQLRTEEECTFTEEE